VVTEKEVVVTVETVRTEKEEVVVTQISEILAEAVEVRWFIGLGAGGESEQIELEKRFVDFFNAQQDEIELVPEFADSSVALDILTTEILAGDAPDIIGPVDYRGTNEVRGAFMDLTDYLAIYDMSDFSEGALRGWTTPEFGLRGLPVNIDPSAIYINKDLFDKADLDYPPIRYDDAYADGDDWSIDKLTELAMLLTLDGNGNNATDAAFDPESIVQFGFAHQWAYPRGWATFFGPGSFLDDAGAVAVCPDHWREAFKWVYDGMWVDHFHPHGRHIRGEVLDGDPFGSGHVAMAHCHTWYTCCVPTEAAWDYATCPSYNGVATAKLDTDMIGVVASTEVPEQAVKAVYDIATSPALINLWGAVPALKSMQGGYMANMAAAHPGVENWNTIMAGLDHIDVPNHDAYMPNFPLADERVEAFRLELEETDGVDVDAAIDILVSDLQAIFDAA
jgi:multiple sugar transport system substrate-binding protein